VPEDSGRDGPDSRPPDHPGAAARRRRRDAAGDGAADRGDRDFLGAASEWKDLEFMFDELERHEESGWKVPVDRRWWVAFERTEGMGAVNVGLVE
jgi:hypothetical protein